MLEKNRQSDLQCAVNREGRELIGVEAIECARFIIETGTEAIRSAPEVSQALLECYLDGSDTNRESFCDGELVFRKGGFVWTSEYRQIVEDAGICTVVFSLSKHLPSEENGRREIEEKVKAMIQRKRDGDIIFATSSYSHRSTLGGKDRNVDVFNKDITMRNARRFLNTFLASKNMK